MLNKIIRFSVTNKLAVGLFMLVWIVYGSYQLTQLPIDAVPEITNDQVQVITSAPALGAEDVERLITFPIELAVSNVPGIKESRSMSRFGLSLITIVFEDGTDVYWARQQVTERLSQVEITSNANTPFLAPVTTGLGEIYQYVLKPKNGYENKYSLSDLRSIQDWSVRRQILGTPGVADVSTFGGELKQYEVAVNPLQLKAMNLSIADIFSALERNNQNTGGAYIEKGPAVLFIRSIGLTRSIEDINRIVVKENNGIPVLIGQVADVRQGSAVRYGALTMAGEGEVCGGIVLMLKGGNSSQVVKAVKKRIKEIEKTLPEGLQIEPFLDRTKMVNNAIGTVERNLLEGALIVVLVLVLFLGNLRAGFIVASVIPLSMLFAVTMMNTFGVSGNLMSLGALDFGLIVDGAVIIVEAVLHHLHSSKKYAKLNVLSQQEMNTEVINSSSRMMNAAVFGQIIILIVYLPILSLTGIEGKMFKPMAQTVAFAILGAFILSLTYVPMISSLAISKRIVQRPNFSERLMHRLEIIYQRMLRRALRVRALLVAGTFAIFVFAVLVFMRMGGEFIPQLEEGDFAVETRMLVGTNLTATIDAINRIADTLQAQYPEVEKIVNRIGTAELPTDPMPIEGGDMVIVLKKKSQWKNAKSFSELADKMSETAQRVVPGVTTGFQYPVQMRFNELMTGAKQDVVCKIFGEDLDQLARYADQLGSIASSVEGTADMYIETVTGMPQIVIDFNRAEIAKYGLDIQLLNRTINAAFAGAVAGKVYEGEKSFDLVVRVGNENRKDIEDVRNLQVSTPSGLQIPLSQVATIEEIEGPNQIQRENAHRRIIVGFNVRGRDVESIVDELQQKVNSQLKMDDGYTISYGGAFENLQQAKQRLSIAVPVALVLIFAMLYFAFTSLKDAALIYTAIPLSAIGGVFALALRDMPFSISAGVGFIALFGVAVLNGIVMMSEINRIRREGKITDIYQVVLAATRNRLRPVLMTASVASLGFLPMALSNGAGAEVQRPLATVVIGGLVSATFLTLFVLPAIYLLFKRMTVKTQKKQVPAAVTILLICLSGIPASAQSTQRVSLERAIEVATKNNNRLKSVQLNERAAEHLQKTGFNPNKAELTADYGKVNSAYNDNRLGLSQSISFPSVYVHQTKMLKSDFQVAKYDTKMAELALGRAVSELFAEYLSMEKRRVLLNYADSIYRLFEEKAELRFQQGAANILEKTSAQSQRQQISNQLQMLETDLKTALNRFNALLQDSIAYIPDAATGEIQIASAAFEQVAEVNNLPAVQRANALAESDFHRWKKEKSLLLPDLTLGYSNQSLQGLQNINGREVFYSSGYRFSYVSAGISIPIFFRSQAGRAEAARLSWQSKLNQANDVAIRLRADVDNAKKEVEKFRRMVDYYDQTGFKNAEAIINVASQQFQEGEINYLEWVMLVNQAITIRNDYINNLREYNQAVISLNYINNQ